MKKSGMFFKNLRYICLVGVIALGLMTIVGSNGGDGDDSKPSDTTTPSTGDTGQVIDTDWITFDVDTAKSLIATENIASTSGRQGVVRQDGRAIPTYVFREPTTEEEAKDRSAATQRQGDEEIGVNLIAIDEDGVASDALESLEELNVMYTVLSKDGKTVYIVLDPDYAYNAVNTVGSTNCMMFAVDLQTNEYTCLDQGYAPQKMDNEFRTTISNGKVKPIQMDDDGDIYYLGRPFEVQGNLDCIEWDDYGNCVQEEMRYHGINLDWRVNPVIRKIAVKTDEDGIPLYNEDGYLLYEGPVDITPDISYISSFLVSRDGLIVYTYENRETFDGGIKMYDATTGSTNNLTEETAGWWGDMFYVIGDGGTVIYGSGTGGWGTGGVKFAQRHPTLTGGRLIYQLNTSLFTSRNNAPTPNRIMLGDDGYIYGLFNEDTGYWDESLGTHVQQARINLFRILPYKQIPIISIEVKGDWWNAMRGFDVQIAKGYAYYVQQQKHPAGAFSARDVIKLTKLVTGDTTTLLQDATWAKRYEIYSWKLVGDKIHFSGWDGSLSQVITGEIDVVKVRQGKPSEEYLEITPAASALGETARIRDMEVLQPEVVYDPVGAPVITKMYTDPENRYSISIDFSKYMNRDDVNSKVSIVNVARTNPSPAEAYEQETTAGEWLVDEYLDLEDYGLTGQEVSANPSTMKVWSYRTLHFIIDNPVLNDDGYALVNATTDPLDADTRYEIFVHGLAFDVANDWQLDMADSPNLSKTFTTVPDNGWYQSTAIALEGYSDGSVGKYVRAENTDTALDFYRLLGTKDRDDTGAWTGTTVTNFKVELSIQYLGDSWHHWSALQIRLNGAKKKDWESVDWSVQTISDGTHYWVWRDGYRIDPDTDNKYAWCNFENCEKPIEQATSVAPGWIDGVYNIVTGDIYIREEGYDYDVDLNRYYWYWDDATNLGGWQKYGPEGKSGGLLATIVWVEGYYTDDATGINYVWDFGEYRNENDSDDIIDWDSGATYTWTSGYHKDLLTNEAIEMPWLEGQSGSYVATYDSDGVAIATTDALYGDSFSENSWWSWDETMGAYYKLDGTEDTDNPTTQSWWDNSWTSEAEAVWVENTKKDDWEARLFRLEFDAAGRISGEYRWGDWDQTWFDVMSTSNEETKREWRKVIVKVYGSNLEISVWDEDGNEITSVTKIDYESSPQEGSETYFLDLNVNSKLLMDNIVVTELDADGNDVGTLFEEDFSSSVLSSTWSDPGEYTSEW